MRVILCGSTEPAARLRLQRQRGGRAPHGALHRLPLAFFLAAARAAPPCCPRSCVAPLDLSSFLFLRVCMVHASRLSAPLRPHHGSRGKTNACNHARAEGGQEEGASGVRAGVAGSVATALAAAGSAGFQGRRSLRAPVGGHRGGTLPPLGLHILFRQTKNKTKRKTELRGSPALCVSGNFQGKQRVFGAPFWKLAS